jgi:hypothetical protein
MPTLAQSVKIAILTASGDNHPDPATLNDDQTMADIGLNQFNYIWLTRQFNQIAHEENNAAERIDEPDVESADKVSDCIDLVNKAVNPATK